MTSDQQLVMSTYPKIELRVINYSHNKKSGSYYVLYDMEKPNNPQIRGYDMNNEHAAWEIAANIIKQKMVDVLEKP